MFFSSFPRICSSRILNRKCTVKLWSTKTKCNEFSNRMSSLFISQLRTSSAFSSLVSSKQLFQLCRSIMSLAEQEESSQTKSHFQQMMLNRKKQSQRSILLQLSNQDDIPYALASCEKFGKIQKAFSVPVESSYCFLLIELADQSEADKLLSNCHCKNIGDAFPVYSRIIQYERLQSGNHPKSAIDLLEETTPVSSLKKGSSVSDVIEDIYVTEQISELNTRIRYFFCTLIRESMSGLFPYCDVLPFGSSVNGLGRQGCDLDVMIRLYPEQVSGDGELFFLSKTCIGDVRALQQKTIFCLGDYFKTFFPGVSSVQKILHARMPILKLKHKILKMDCDVSINNMSAVLMSEIIYFCGEIDNRVRPLLYAVKRWAKEADITYDTPGTYITNFGLTMLVIFFLQNRPNPILPSFNEALIIQGIDPSPEYRIQYLKSLSEFQATASLNEESLAQLLKEFLVFLGTFSFKTCTISLMTGTTVSREKGGSMCVQYPFEEDLNVTKNISDFECLEMAEKAQISAKYLDGCLNKKSSSFQDFATILGIPNLKKRGSSKANNIISRVDDLSNFSKNKANLKRRK